MKNLLFTLTLLLIANLAFTQYDYYDTDPWSSFEYCQGTEVHREVIDLTDSILTVLGLERNFEFLKSDNALQILNDIVENLNQNF